MKSRSRKSLIVVLFVFVLQAFSLLPHVEASIPVSSEEVKARVDSALEALEGSDVERRFEATMIIRRWARYAPQATPVLIRSLGDPSPKVRTGAAYALEEIGPDDEKATTLLTDLLTDQESSVRTAAAFALVSIPLRGELSQSPLLKLLNGPIPEEKIAAAAVLSKNGFSLPPAVGRTIIGQTQEALRSSLRESTATQSIRLSRSLYWIDPEAALKMVPELVEKAEYDTKEGSNAAWALRTIGRRFGKEYGLLIRQAKNGNEVQKTPAVRALGWLGSGRPAIIAFLSDLAETSHQEIQIASCEALGRLGQAAYGAIGTLSRIVESQPGDLRAAAARAVVQISGSEANEMISHLKESDPDLALELEGYLLLSRL